MRRRQGRVSSYPMAEAAAAPSLEEPVGFEALGDDLVLRACLRAPFMTHGSLHAVCHRFKSLLRSDDFRKQRLEYGLAEYGVVLAGGARYKSTDCWMLSEGQWRSIPSMSGPRYHTCSVIIDNEMWVMGGEYGGPLATVEVYSPKTNSWRSCTPMSQRRTGAVAGVVNGRLVVAGGYCGHHDLTSAEAYTGIGWTPLPPMPHAALFATACVLNGRLYVIGGVGSNRLQVLEMTEENGLSWSRKADLPANRSFAASVVHQDRIWVMGGKLNDRPTTSVLTYDAGADVWGTGPPLPAPCACCRAAPLDGGVFLFDHRRSLRPAAGAHRATPVGLTAYAYKNAAWSEAARPPRAVFVSACGGVLLG